MRIAYCEDEAAQAVYIRGMITEWAESRSTAAEVLLFGSAEEFLFKNEEYPYDMVLLDIAMKQMNGVELAHAIRGRDKRISIAFLTADRGFALEGYEVGAIRYLVKPVVKEKLYELMDALLAESAENAEDGKCFMVEEKGMLRKVKENTLCYMEACGHYTELHMADAAVIRIKESLGGIVSRIHDKDLFVKCHRSYAVNLIYVEKISRTECILSNTAVLPVSRSSYQELNEKFIKHYMGMDDKWKR